MSLNNLRFRILRGYAVPLGVVLAGIGCHVLPGVAVAAPCKDNIQKIVDIPAGGVNCQLGGSPAVVGSTQLGPVAYTVAAAGLATFTNAGPGGPWNTALPFCNKTAVISNYIADGVAWTDDAPGLCRTTCEVSAPKAPFCLDGLNVSSGHWQATGSGGALRPGDLVVTVCMPEAARLEMRLVGPRSADKDQTKVAERKPKLVYGKDEPCAKVTLSDLKAGDYDLSVADPSTGNSIATSFTVVATYAGAVRVGVAAVFGGARDRSYSAAKPPDAKQSEIVRTSGGSADVEVVIGAGVFLSPREYATAGGRRLLGRIAPYFGIGVINSSDTALQLLKSLHLGLEFEISEQASIAVTAVARKVTRLRAGYFVGSPLGEPAAAVPTESGYEFGTAIVLNLSSDLLRVARTSMTSLFSESP